MSKELSPEQNSLIEGLIEKHNPEGLYSLVDVQKGAMKAAMEELVTMLSPEWVSVKERLPPINLPVLVLLEYGNQSRKVKTSHFSHYHQCFDLLEENIVTHWMFMPIKTLPPLSYPLNNGTPPKQ